MHWTLKARIQNVAARLPPRLGNNVYYIAQRRFGGLRSACPKSRLQAGLDVVCLIEKERRTVSGTTVLEIGTGHQINLPIALWLCGADQVITIDLNRYLKAELVRRDLSYIEDHTDEIVSLFGERASEPVFQRRLAVLLQRKTWNLSQLLESMNIRYLAPADAARLDLEKHSVDYHVSYTVLEHIAPETLIRIFREGKRVIRASGLFIHCIDFSDHFAHSDSSISSVNFLQFSEEEWTRIANNRFMYHNRLRVDEFRALLDESDLDVIKMDRRVDEQAKQILEDNSLLLNTRFRGRTSEVNATSHAWVVARAR